MATKTDLEAEVARLRNDIVIIGNNLKQEAENRSWCSDYAEFVNEVNGETSERHLPEDPRRAQGKVTIEFTRLDLDDHPAADWGDLSDRVQQWFIDNVVDQHYALDSVIVEHAEPQGDN